MRASASGSKTRTAGFSGLSAEPVSTSSALTTEFNLAQQEFRLEPQGPWYAVNFSVHYHTNFGEYVSVVGSIEQLGYWKEFKCRLAWSGDHNWVSSQPLLIGSNQEIFQYRYVLLKEDHDRPVDWEKGVDRIADLKILPEIKMTDA